MINSSDDFYAFYAGAEFVIKSILDKISDTNSLKSVENELQNLEYDLHEKMKHIISG